MNKEQILKLEAEISNVTTEIASTKKASEVKKLEAKKASLESELASLVKESGMDNFGSGLEGHEPGGQSNGFTDATDLYADEVADDDIPEEAEEVLESEGSGDLAAAIGEAVAETIEGSGIESVDELIQALDPEGAAIMEEETEFGDDEEFEPTPSESAEEEAEEPQPENPFDEGDEGELKVASAGCSKCNSKHFVKKAGKIVCKECGSKIVITIEPVEGEDEIDVNNELEDGVDDVVGIFEEAGDELAPDGSKEHEEAESPEFEAGEEEEEHEDEFGSEDEDDEDFFEKKAFSVKLVKKADVNKTYYVVYEDKVPVIKVSAKDAWGDDVSVKPYEPVLSAYATYYDYFISPIYAQKLVKQCENIGFYKVCEEVHGKLSKTAQSYGADNGIGSAKPNNPLRDGNPTQTTSTGNPDETVGEAEPGTLNPDADASMDMAGLGGGEEKLLITDMIINWLAAEVANGTYTVEEVRDEMKATFSDDAATSEFEGELKAKADNFKDGASEKEEEAPAAAEENVDDLGADFGLNPSGETPQTSATPAGDSGQSGQIPKMASVVDELKAKLAESEKGNAEKEALINMRFKVKSAMDFVKNEMLTRGNLGMPLIHSASTLIAEGKDEATAIKEAEEIYAATVKKIASMTDNEFKIFEEGILRTPKLSNDADDASAEFAASMAKAASANQVPFQEISEVKTGLDALLPDEIFETKLGKVAQERLAQRGISKWNG